MAATKPFPISRHFTVREVAVPLGVDPATARQWFTDAPGVIHRPRGKGNQQPFLLIPVEVVRETLRRMRVSEDLIESIIQAHDAKMDAEERAREERKEAKRVARKAAYAKAAKAKRRAPLAKQRSSKKAVARARR